MADLPTIEAIDIDDLQLDPRNPRLRRAHDQALLSQEQLLDEMTAWELDELILSFTKSGFWRHEPLIIVDNPNAGLSGKYVIEGNRRAAALKCVRAYLRGQRLSSRRITRIIEEALADFGRLDEDNPMFTSVPCVLYDTRSEVDAYLGFRHVTGIKQWKPQEKATFIAHLIDERDNDYSQTADLIGSKPETVRRNYIAFHLLNTFEDLIESDDGIEALDYARDDFSVFFLSLREEGVRKYLGISLEMEPIDVREGIRGLEAERVSRFLVWMFGTESQDAFIGESRNVKRFAEILSTPEAVEYISEKPSADFEVAYSMTKGAADDVVAALKEVRLMMRNVLADLDLKREEPEVVEAAWPAISAAADIALRLGGETLEKLRKTIRDARDT
jgi:hypothetical protein